MPLITNDAVVLGILMSILGLVFATYSSNNRYFQVFYRYVPVLFVCYFLPSVLATCNIISGDFSNLYKIVSRYLLPPTLVLLTLSVDIPAILKLGPKVLIMFLTGTFGVIIGGPIALWLVSSCFPGFFMTEGPDAAWRGLATLAGTWIGATANQVAAKAIFEVGDNIFSAVIAVDVLLGGLWIACLFWVANNAKRLDEKIEADVTAIEELKKKMMVEKDNTVIPKVGDTLILLAIAFGLTALANVVADILAPWFERTMPELARSFSLNSQFFWVLILVTTGALLLSFSRYTQYLEGVGASRIGVVLIYVLVATIGMKMNLLAIFQYPLLFLVGVIWLAVHLVCLLVMAKLIKAPIFYLAVGSQANIGGAASAPVVAAAFHPSLAPVGVLIAVLGYAIGTYGYGAWICGQLMRFVV